MTVTPVLADQLEAPGRRRAPGRVRARVPARLLPGRRRRAGGRAPRPCPGGGRALPARPRAPRAPRERPARGVSPGAGGGPRGADRLDRDARGAAAARHRRGRRLQLDAGLRSHRRRFGEPGGIWLPECAYEPGLERLLAEHDLRFFCTDQSAHEPPDAALRPIATEAGPVAFPIDWEAVSWLWSLEGYPVRSRAHRLPPRVAAGRPRLVDRRGDPRPRGGRGAGPRAGPRVPRRGRGPASRPPRANRVGAA